MSETICKICEPINGYFCVTNKNGRTEFNTLGEFNLSQTIEECGVREVWIKQENEKLKHNLQRLVHKAEKRHNL
jgi:hypothetical protein